MGLRELKTARTRDLLVETALELFLEQGYDQTTMEQIAERAEVGTSTLYRYFPSKDLLILERLARAMDFARLLEARAPDEPIDEALGGVIHDALEGVEHDERFAAVRRIIDASPVPRARLWDVVLQGRSEFEAVLGQRLDLPTDDLLVTITSRLVYALFEIIGEEWWAGDHHGRPAARVAEVLDRLGSLDLVLPSAQHRSRRSSAGAASRP